MLLLISNMLYPELQFGVLAGCICIYIWTLYLHLYLPSKNQLYLYLYLPIEKPLYLYFNLFSVFVPTLHLKTCSVVVICMLNCYLFAFTV